MSKTTAEYIRTQDFDTIKFTRDEYAQTIENIEEGALLDAADKLWEGVKGSVEAYWEAMGLLVGTDSVTAKIRDRKTERLRVRLHTYMEAFEVMGCELKVAYDWCPKAVYQVTLICGNNVRGCIRR